MGDRHKVLIISPAHASFLLPERVLTDDDCSYSLLYQEVNDALTGGVQVVVNLSIACVRDAFHLFRHALSIRFGKLLVELLHALVVPLVPRFDRTTVNQVRRKALEV